MVNLCVDRRTGREYACKVLPKVRGRLTPAKTAKKIWQEVELLSRVQSCGNVARLQSVFEDDERVYIVLELCQGGDLEQLLEVRLPEMFGTPLVHPPILHGCFTCCFYRYQPRHQCPWLGAGPWSADGAAGGAGAV